MEVTTMFGDAKEIDDPGPYVYVGEPVVSRIDMVDKHSELMMFLIKTLIKKDGSIFKSIISNYPSIVTKSICRLAVDSSPEMIQYVPKNMRTNYLWGVAISKEPTCVQYLTRSERNYSRYKKAISLQPNVIRYIDKNYSRYNDLCRFAIDVGGPFTITVIDDITDELLLYAIEKCSSVMYEIRHHHKHRLTPEFISKAIKLNPEIVKYMGDPYSTEDRDIYIHAIRADPTVIKYVHCQIPVLCIEALKRDFSCIRLIEKVYQIDEVCSFFIKFSSKSEWKINKHYVSNKNFKIKMMMFLKNIGCLRVDE